MPIATRSYSSGGYVTYPVWNYEPSFNDDAVFTYPVGSYTITVSDEQLADASTVSSRAFQAWWDELFQKPPTEIYKYHHRMAVYSTYKKCVDCGLRIDT